MNVATYVYIVHSDINENNIYAEFATEEEAIDYAKRHKDELTYVDKVEVTLDEAGDIDEIFDERTIWVYDEEDEEEDEEINEFDTDFEDDESEGWSVCVVTPDDGDSDWEHFDSESEARDYFDNYTSYESGREVEVQLYGPDGMEDSYTIGADEDLDESLLEKITISEGIKLRNDAERKEFFRLCDEIGIYTDKDIVNFKKEVGCTDENILQALRDYRAELGPDFKIANPELEREMAKKYEDIDFDGLVEELEEHEDMVECKECYDLVAKESCIKGEHGYVCEKCSKASKTNLKESFEDLTEADIKQLIEVPFQTICKKVNLDLSVLHMSVEPILRKMTSSELYEESVYGIAEVDVEFRNEKDKALIKKAFNSLLNILKSKPEAKYFSYATKEYNKVSEGLPFITLTIYQEWDADLVDIEAEDTLNEYWFNDEDPKNWSDKEPIIYEVYYKNKLVGYLEFNYRGYDVDPDKHEIEKALTSLHADLVDEQVIPENSKVSELTYSYGYDNWDDNLPVISEALSLDLRETSVGTPIETKSAVDPNKSGAAAKELKDLVDKKDKKVSIAEIQAILDKYKQ